MTHVTATISGEQRDAIHELLIDRLGGLSDVRIAIGCGELDTARRLAREFTQDFRLLDDLGWGEDERLEVPLTIPPEELAAICGRLRADARGALVESAEERDAREAEEQSRRRYGLVLDASTDLLLELDGGSR